jgi:TPR repeat protein
MLRYAFAGIIIGSASLAGAQDWAASCATGRGQDKVLSCNMALKAAPKDIGLRRHLGRALLDIGDGMGGATEFGGIAEELKTDAGAWFDYAAALATDYRFTEAATAIARSLALDPDRFEANKIAVIAFERAGRDEEAYQASLRLAGMGDRIAMNDIAEALLEGRGVAANPPAAVPWFERAAAAGHIGAMDRLARIHREGLYGRKPDAALAEQWAKKAEEAQ